MKHPFEAAALALLLLAAGLTSCTPRWDICQVDTWDHPTKPRPAVEARVRCTRTVMCDRYADGKCDGEQLAKGAK